MSERLAQGSCRAVRGPRVEQSNPRLVL